jgi:hypothetical protein
MFGIGIVELIIILFILGTLIGTPIVILLVVLNSNKKSHAAAGTARTNDATAERRAPTE